MMPCVRYDCGLKLLGAEPGHGCVCLSLVVIACS